MEYSKTFYTKELQTLSGTLIIEGPLSGEKMSAYEFHEDLVTFPPCFAA